MIIKSEGENCKCCTHNRTKLCPVIKNGRYRPYDTDWCFAFRNCRTAETLKDELAVEKTHASTADFCSSEWKNDCDELKALLKRAVEIIETVNAGSSQEQEEQFMWLRDARAVL